MIVFASVYIRLLKMFSFSGKTLMSGRKLEKKIRAKFIFSLYRTNVTKRLIPCIDRLS